MVFQSPIRGTFDWGLVFAIIALMVLGLMMLYSATTSDNHAQFRKQLLWTGLAIIVLLIAAGPHYQFWASASMPIYLGCLALLVLVILIGPDIRGSRSWLRFGSVSFQPAEAAKVATVLMLANYMAEKQGFGLTIRKAGVMAAIVAAPVALIMLQPDLGSALIFFPILGVMVFLAGLRWRVVVALLLAIVVAVPLLWPHMKPYQQERVLTFFKPDRDPQGVGWQIMQSRIAVGSGGMFGKGVGAGSQGQLNFLPDRHTDFIFSVLAEETGFAGVSTALALYGVLLYSCLVTARTARDRLGASLSMGVAALLGSQIIINIGVILGLMPTAGIPLPLMSYGGSSLLSSAAALGLVLNVRMKCLVN